MSRLKFNLSLEEDVIVLPPKEETVMENITYEETEEDALIELTNDGIAIEQELIECGKKINLHEELHTNLLEHQELLGDIEGDVETSAVVLANEHMKYTMYKLGYTIQDTIPLRLSKECKTIEDFTNHINVSIESIGSALSAVGRAIIDLLKSIYRSIKKFTIKAMNMLESKTKKIHNLIDQIYKYENVSIPKLQDKQSQKIFTMFYTFIMVNKDELDFNHVIDAVSRNDRNPFITKLDSVYKLATGIPDQNDVDKLVETIKSESKNLPYQKELLDHLLKNTNIEGDPMFVVSCKGYKLKVYTRLKQEAGLGFKIVSYNYEFDKKSHRLTFKNANKLHDLIPILKRLIELSSSKNSYLNGLEVYNKNAIKEVTKLEREAEKLEGSETDPNFATRQAIMKSGFKFLRDVGSQMSFDLMSNYSYNVNAMINAVEMIAKETMGGK